MVRRWSGVLTTQCSFVPTKTVTLPSASNAEMRYSFLVYFILLFLMYLFLVLFLFLLLFLVLLLFFWNFIYLLTDVFSVASRCDVRGIPEVEGHGRERKRGRAWGGARTHPSPRHPIHPHYTCERTRRERERWKCEGERGSSYSSSSRQPSAPYRAPTAQSPLSCASWQLIAGTLRGEGDLRRGRFEESEGEGGSGRRR